MSVQIYAEDLEKSYQLPNGDSVEAIADVSLHIEPGEFISLLGPSGCGKSTLIKLLAGLLEPSEGMILVGGQRPREILQNLGVVFQHYNLFPWLTVHKNIEFGLMVADVPAEKRQEITAHYVEVMGLEGFEHTYPKELSGGMQQRVSLARTLATNPDILLMDEPFSALDVQTKRFMQDLLLQLLRHEPRTTVFVTHDVEEAVFMSDRVFVMSARPGTIRQIVEIDLPRPRDLKVEYSERSLELQKQLQEIITKESLGLAKLDLEIYKGL